MLRGFRELCQAMYSGLSDFFPTTDAQISKAQSLVEKNPYGSPAFMEGMTLFDDLLATHGPLTRSRILDITGPIIGPKIEEIWEFLAKKKFTEAELAADNFLQLFPDHPEVKQLKNSAKIHVDPADCLPNSITFTK